MQVSSDGVPIPDLDPPWADVLKIAVVTSRDSRPAWRAFAHEVAAVVQPGGRSFPLAERRSTSDAGHDRAAFLYRNAGRVVGYLCLERKIVTGYRDARAEYRQVTEVERLIRPCVMVVWVAPKVRRQGIARDLVEEAAQQAGVTLTGLAWAEPFTDRGYFLAHSVTPDGLWNRGLHLRVPGIHGRSENSRRSPRVFDIIAGQGVFRRWL